MNDYKPETASFLIYTEHEEESSTLVTLDATSLISLNISNKFPATVIKQTGAPLLPSWIK